MEISYTEENYLKALYTLSQGAELGRIRTRDLAERLEVKPASVNDMLKRLKEKSCVEYEKYGKIQLTEEGNLLALQIIRKHRLWETFLYNTLGFGWEQVHEIAEELEHIQSTELVNRLDKFLGFPTYDPHGDPIPNVRGEIEMLTRTDLNEVEVGKTCKVVGVRDSSEAFLRYARQQGIELGTRLSLLFREDFDGQTQVKIGRTELSISQKFASNLYVELCD